MIEHGLDFRVRRRRLAPASEADFLDGDDLERGPYLAGDAFSNADCAVIPYILRLELLKLGAMWRGEPAIVEWWERVRSRPSVKSTVFERMGEATGIRSRTFLPIRGRRCRVCLKRRDGVFLGSRPSETTHLASVGRSRVRKGTPTTSSPSQWRRRFGGRLSVRPSAAHEALDYRAQHAMLERQQRHRPHAGRKSETQLLELETLGLSRCVRYTQRDLRLSHAVNGPSSTTLSGQLGWWSAAPLRPHGGRASHPRYGRVPPEGLSQFPSVSVRR